MATDPQSLEETAKAHVSSTVTKLIQATTANTKAELPLHSIVAASLSKQHELVSTLATQIADQVEPAQRDAINALVTQNKDIAESVTKQITIFTQDDLGISLLRNSASSFHWLSCLFVRSLSPPPLVLFRKFICLPKWFLVKQLFPSTPIV